MTESDALRMAADGAALHRAAAREQVPAIEALLSTCHRTKPESG
jgi:hypothetical protein